MHQHWLVLPGFGQLWAGSGFYRLYIFSVQFACQKLSRNWSNSVKLQLTEHFVLFWCSRTSTLWNETNKHYILQARALQGPSDSGSQTTLKQWQVCRLLILDSVSTRSCIIMRWANSSSCQSVTSSQVALVPHCRVLVTPPVDAQSKSIGYGYSSTQNDTTTSHKAHTQTCWDKLYVTSNIKTDT